MNKPLTNSTCNYACHNVEQSGEGMIILAWTVQDNVGVASGLLVKALDCRSKGLGFCAVPLAAEIYFSSRCTQPYPKN